MELKIASNVYGHQTVSFFNSYLRRDNDAIYSFEFFCPDGVKAAIGRKQILLALDNQRIVGALRFYKKKSGVISLYQFAIDEAYRKQNLLVAMLEMIKVSSVESLCPINSTFNDYYRKSGWSLSGQFKNLNRWTYG
ncbi:N-acetyltransferase [Paenibacillus sp. FSL H8-0537]|uniref:N-acetyltransferase n=1 Tax=Paenibacillus sp. FSL H8-0537 TaxID=2921399 RepID=UPI00310123C2